MKESPKQSPQLENAESDQERLRYLARRINNAVNGAKGEVREKFLRHAREKQIATYTEEYSKLRHQYYENSDAAALQALDVLRKELNQDVQLSSYMPEVNAYIEAVRALLNSEKIVKYKEYQVAKGAPRLTSAEIKKQDKLREDIIEGKALLQWHILQNETNPGYLKEFLTNIGNMLGNLGLSEEKDMFMHGLVQELGVYKLLRRYFPNVIPATPREDARYAIDFWVETRGGRKLLIQSKSSAPLGKNGVFTETRIHLLRREAEKEVAAGPEYYVGFEGEEYFSPIAKAKRLEKDIVRAKKYAEKKGVEGAEFYLIVANWNKFEYPTGEPKPDQVRSLERRLRTLATQ